MPWNERDYPRSMANLPPRVRAKAIEIANALLEQGYEEGKAIRIGIAQARHWAERVIPDRRASAAPWGEPGSRDV